MAVDYPVWVMRELGGKKREVRLLGRTLPYQGVAFPVEQRMDERHYQGNPEATQQVYGPKWGPIDFNGYWKDRYMAVHSQALSLSSQGIFETSSKNGSVPSATLKGEAVETAADMARLFESLTVEAQEMELSWGDVAFRGRLASFTPEYKTEKDIVWRSSFRVLGKAMQAKSEYVSDFEPGSIAQDWISKSASFITKLKGYLGKVKAWEGKLTAYITRVDRLRVQAQSLMAMATDVATAPMRILSRTIQTATNMADVWGEIKRDAQEFRVSSAAVGGRIADMMQAYGVSSDLVLTARQNQADALGVAAAGRRRVEAIAPATKVVRVVGDTHVSRLSNQHYGNPNGGDRILSANGLHDSIVPSGTVIIIPGS